MIPDNKLIKNEGIKPYLQEFIEKKKIKQDKYSEEDVKEEKLINILCKNMKNIKKKSGYKCFKCDKKVSKERTLKSHQKKECGKTFSCLKCGKKYSYDSSLSRHRQKCLRPKTM